MRYVLALDAGGTKCDALFVQEDGTVLGWGHVSAEAAGNGRNIVGFGRDPRSINQAIQQAMGGARCDELDLTGFAYRLPLDVFSEKNFGILHLHRIFEYEPAFTLLEEKAGVIALAGTGALVFTRTRDGRELHLDGLGPQLGDFGGGYQIGLLGLQATAKAGWHRRHQTSLALRIMQVINAEREIVYHEALIEFMLTPRDRTDIAGFARIVDEEARAGDRIAIDILHRAADDLAETVWDAVDQLGLAGEDYPLIGLGSIALKSEIFWEHLCRRVHAFAPKFRCMRPELPPVVGMALIVLQRIAAADPQVLRENLYRSVKEYI
jgi:N-acetylglucosamine kinase-like BadF-type ATPase